MRAARLGSTAVTVAAALACAPEPRAEVRGNIVILVPAAAGLPLSAVSVSPPSIVERLLHDATSLTVSWRGQVRAWVEISIPGACPVRVAPEQLVSGSELRLPATPLFELGPAARTVGYDADFEIRAEPGCPEAAASELTWRQVAGAPLAAWSVSERGRRVSGRTRSLPERYRERVPWGVVPIAASERFESVLEASFASARVRLSIAAADRSPGLESVAVGARLLLGGDRWSIVRAPAGAGSVLGSNPPFTSFQTAVSGIYELRDGAGRALELRAARYDETPLDCGRAECHAQTAAAAAASPMSSVFARLLATPRLDYPACALGCHTVGERSAADGGFAHVLGELGWNAASLQGRTWGELPPALRRLASVGCLACHGPGAIQERSLRGAILHSDVCATCHDAPPRYGHVTAWRSSRMARPSADDRTRSRTECAACHTTSGFLVAQGWLPELRAAPFDGPREAIGCAGCHAVHAHEHPGPGLIRRPEPGPELRDVPFGRAQVCVPCHAGTVEGRVAGSSALIWAGRGGVEPSDGRPLVETAPHTAVADACLGCHRAGPAGLERGAGHAFAVDREACRACHDTAVIGAAPALRERALGLLRALEPRSAPGTDRPPHADARTPAASALGRALHDVALVLEDRGAFAHNPRYAARLLDAAAGALAEAKR